VISNVDRDPLQPLSAQHFTHTLSASVYLMSSRRLSGVRGMGGKFFGGCHDDRGSAMLSSGRACLRCMSSILLNLNGTQCRESERGAVQATWQEAVRRGVDQVTDMNITGPAADQALLEMDWKEPDLRKWFQLVWCVIAQMVSTGLVRYCANGFNWFGVLLRNSFSHLSLTMYP